MTIRLIATDIDGTILPHLGEPSPRTVATLRACQAQGVDVVLVTGRPLRWLPYAIEPLGFTGTVICVNGATIVQAPHLEVTEMTALPTDVVGTITEQLGARWPRAALGVETLEGLVTSRSHEDGWKYAPDVVTRSVADLARPEVVKVLARCPGVPADDLMAHAQELLGDGVVVSHSNSADCLIEVAPTGVTKASTLARWCAARGIASTDVVAFGDMPNDVPMLQWAHLSYAMAGGHPATIDAADRVAPACAEDGVARVLDSIVLQPRKDAK